MVNWQIVFTKQAQKDAKKLAESHLRQKASVDDCDYLFPIQHFPDIKNEGSFRFN
jgi:mRNA-degrading endonuclease RelE of RelBE toxin-antitoxin system